MPKLTIERLWDLEVDDKKREAADATLTGN